MTPRAKPVLVAVSSATEARSLVPVVDELTRRDIDVDVVDTGPIGAGNASAALPPRFRTRRLGLLSHLSGNAMVTPATMSVLVLGNDELYLTRKLAEAGRRNGVPAVLVQEGATWQTSQVDIRKSPAAALGHPVRVLFQIRQHIENHDFIGLIRRAAAVLGNRPVRMPAYGMSGTDVICVATSRIGSEFLAAGARSRIEVTGIPNLLSDQLSNVRLKPSFDVVFISAPLAGAGICSESRYRAYVRQLMWRLKEALPNASVAVKIHPSRENANSYTWLTREFPEAAILVNVERGELISSGRAFVSFGSTLMLDVWYAGRAGQCLVESDMTEPLETAPTYELARRHGATVSVSHKAATNLASKLTSPIEALVNEVRHEYERSVGTSAAVRIADVIECLRGTRLSQN